MPVPSMSRARWAAIGAAVAVSLGAGGVGLLQATAPSDAAAFVPITPCRLFDTRPAPHTVGARTAPLGPDEIYDIAARGVQGNCTLPDAAVGVVLNVTAVDATQATFLTLFPTGAERPTASHLNPSPGAPPAPNAVTVDLSDSGTFSVFNRFGQVHVLADVVGYYTDHHHDDRYYTKAQTDAAIGEVDNAILASSQLSKSLSLNVYADPGLNFDYEPYGDLTDAGLGGINLDVDFNFTVPRDYTPGSPLELRVLGYARDSTAFPCNGQLAESWLYATRADVGRLHSDPRMVPNDIVHVFTEPDIPHLYAFELLPDVAVLPGDAVSFGLFNFAPATRCEVVVTGAAIHYG